jgi:hypothetical protein
MVKSLSGQRRSNIFIQTQLIFFLQTHSIVKILEITNNVNIEKSDSNHRYDPNYASVTAIVVDDSYIYAGSERGFIQIWEKRVYKIKIIY